MLRQLPDIDHEEELFLREIRFSPDDEDQRAVYADWLEERGDPRAEFLRVDRELAQTAPDQPDRRTELIERRTVLKRQIDLRWIAYISDAPIEKCTIEFSYLCPMRWESLRVLDDEATIRYCDQCGREVHFCDNVDAARDHARKKHCVAIDPSAARTPGDIENLDDPPSWPLNLGIIDLDF